MAPGSSTQRVLYSETEWCRGMGDMRMCAGIAASVMRRTCTNREGSTTISFFVLLSQKWSFYSVVCRYASANCSTGPVAATDTTLCTNTHSG